MDSILDSVKKLLGIGTDYNHFDNDLIIHINTVLIVLNQLGVGPENGFSIVDSKDKWGDFINDEVLLNPVKTYVYLKVRLLFDPPVSSSVTEAIKSTIGELEFRINAIAETLNK